MTNDLPVSTIGEQPLVNLPFTDDGTLVDDPSKLVDDPNALVGGPTTMSAEIPKSIVSDLPQSNIHIYR